MLSPSRLPRAAGLALALGAALVLTLALLPQVTQGAQNSWSQLDLDNLRVNVVAADPNDPNVLFAGTNGQGIFRSADGGQNWAQVNSGLGNLFVNDILIDPTNSNNVLAATGRGSAVGEATAGVYRSTDRGGSWTRVLAAGTIWALAITPQNSSVLYASGGPPLFKSTDGGATWNPSFVQGTDIVNVELRGITVSPADPSVLLTAGNTEGGDGQVFRSTNAGASWDRVLAGQAAILDISFVTDLRAGVIAFFGNLVGVFRSTDSGLAWQQVTGGLGNVEVRRIGPNPLNGNAVAAATGGGVIRSTDAGMSFSQLDGSLAGLSSRDVTYNRATPQTLFAGTDDGAWAFTFVQPTPTPTPGPAAATSFFAEGSTQPPFDTWFLVQNPTGNAASVRFTFLVEGAGVQTRDFSVGPNTRFSLFVNQILPNVAFSTRVDSNQQIFVERSMFVGFDGSVITGIAAPNSSWLFAEGATVQPFDTWVLIQNPNNVPANTTVTYLLRDRAPVVQALGALAPNSRTSVFVNQVLPNEEFGIRVDSDQPIIAEESTFRFPGNAATATEGATTSSRSWFFAEGSSLQSPLATDT
ncbi:MAG: WD40/YVTN/BNR-like repeat-containing protein, partial [Chloroflexota bacterium]